MNETATRPVAVTDKDFGEQVINSTTPVLVDFWAEWCGPCRALGPIIESLSEEFSGQVKIAKVDVDSNPQLSMQFGIRSIPTVMLFDKGQVVDTFIGVRPKSDYSASLQKVIT
ncbi:MAG: thioredoxin [Woeseiaceae bacterium]